MLVIELPMLVKDVVSAVSTEERPDGFQNGLLTWCKVREGDTFLTFFMQMYLKNNAA